MAKTAVVAGLLLLAAAGAHALDKGERAAAAGQFAWSAAGASLDQVAAYEPAGAKQCAASASADVAALVRALVTVENIATPRLEAWGKAALVRVAVPLGLGVPDLTYGPGRVRLSIARAVLRNSGEGVPADAVLAVQLLETCGAIRVVTALVGELVDPEGAGAAMPIDLAAVRKVARIYNGQALPTTAEAAVAHATYNSLVYALYQRYRFEALAR